MENLDYLKKRKAKKMIFLQNKFMVFNPQANFVANNFYQKFVLIK